MKYPYDQLDRPGAFAMVRTPRVLASVREAARQYGKRHGMKIEVTREDEPPEVRKELGIHYRMERAE
jgi:hypothetical protein